MPIDLICLDADDTLWHCETHFQGAQAHFAALVAPYADRAPVPERLEAINARNSRPTATARRASPSR